MMPNITRGGRMAGLMVYLAGGGRANEHTDQHVIAGHDVVTQAVGSAPLTTDTALDLANVLEQPSRVFGTEILTPSKLYHPDTGEHVRTDMVDGHVWHASLSIKADEGKLSDAQWSKIANDFVEGMGFVDPDGAKSNRWVAVRHGSSKAGNDHIHIAVNLVREDGTKANVWQDYHRSQKLAHELEKKYGLDVLQSREKGAGLSADKPAEQRRAVEGERTATMRDDLRRRLRAAVASSTDEASFIQAAKNNRVLVRPRFEQGGTSKVVGYSAALIPGDGKGEPKQPIWYAPSKLDRTLGLTRLRATWGTEAATPEALSGWVGMQTDLRERSVDVTAKVKREQILTAQMQRMIDREKQLTPDKENRLSLAHKPEIAAVVDLANVYSRVSMSLEGGKPGPIQQASDEYARLAQQKGTPAPTVAANLAYQSRLMTRGMGRDSRTGWIAVFRQMERLGNSIQNVHRAKGDLATAELLRGRSVAALAAAQQHLTRIEAAQGRSAPIAQQNVQARVNRETSERDAGTEIER
jgi:hypothetical protein